MPDRTYKVCHAASNAANLIDSYLANVLSLLIIYNFETMRQTAKLPQPILQLFQDFVENYPPQQFSNCLRRVLLDYMKKYVSTGFPPYFEDFLRALSDLFDLLDKVASHQQTDIQ